MNTDVLALIDSKFQSELNRELIRLAPFFLRLQADDWKALAEGAIEKGDIIRGIACYLQIWRKDQIHQVTQQALQASYPQSEKFNGVNIE